MKLRIPGGIRHRIILAFIVLILIVGVLFSIVHFIISLRQTVVQSVEAIKSLKELAEINYRLHVDNMQPLAKQYVNLKVKDNSKILSEMFANRSKYGADIRSVATQFIFSNGKKVGSLYLSDNKGNVIYSQFKDHEGKNIKNIIGYDKVSEEEISKTFENIVKEDNNSGYYTYKNKGSNAIEYLFFASSKIAGTDYFLFGFIDLHKYLDPIYQKYKAKEKHIIGSLEYTVENEFYRSWHTIVWVSLLVLIFLCAVCSLIGLLFADYLARPILRLRNAVVGISAGNFNVKVEEAGTIETVELAKAFNGLGEKLFTYIENLKNETALRESIESEIKIAKVIQQSTLPKLTDSFKRKEFDLVVDLVPARVVAGDFYDFFYLNEDKNKLIMVLGDVSGKGVPAAFFMGILKTTIRNFCEVNFTESPGCVLSMVNKEIFSRNSENMFASVFLMYYDISTGVMTYANAGHHSSILIKKDYERSYFGKNNDPLIGFFNDINYSTNSLKLLIGEGVFCYTDGIIDASIEDEFYGEKRLDDNLKRNIALPSEIFLKSLVKEVLDYQNNSIFDDIAVLFFKRNV